MGTSTLASCGACTCQAEASPLCSLEGFILWTSCQRKVLVTGYLQAAVQTRPARAVAEQSSAQLSLAGAAVVGSGCAMRLSCTSNWAGSAMLQGAAASQVYTHDTCVNIWRPEGTRVVQVAAWMAGCVAINGVQQLLSLFGGRTEQ